MKIKKFIKRGIQYILHGVPTQYVKANVAFLQPNEMLKGKNIIITGGGRGLGAAMAEKFTREGANVLIAGRSESTLKETVARIGCKYCVLDVTKISDFSTFIRKADMMMGGINCLVCNAGISLHEGSFMNVNPDTFDAQISTNLKGSYFLAQEFIKYVLEKKLNNANILFVSSEKGVYVDYLPYGLTKRAINSLTQALANEYIHYGIRVNAIAPGITASDMTGLSAEGNLYASYQINRRVYLPEEVAEVASFLISDASSCLSGQILICDEGKTVNRPLEIKVFDRS